ncbi:MAG: ABC transporter permease [Clostridiales bacterium]|jgi:peptide/nickel transport system permease protein|nr:ABC transporter permease [Clostridiales bacterium]
MYRYVLRRLALLVFTVFCVITLVFALLARLPGTPGRMILGPNVPNEDVEAYDRMVGYDRPAMVRYGELLKGIVTRFDFGRSYRSDAPVMAEIARRLPVTLRLALFGVLVAIVLGVPLGVLAALRRSTLTDSAIVVWAIFLAAIPAFFLALLLVYLFSRYLHWLPTHGTGGWKNYVLPVIAMGVPGSTGFIRLTRVLMLETVNQEYVKTARAKGLREYKVIWKHAFKNAMLPIINGAGLAFSALLGGAIIIETIFSMPGLGYLALEAVRSKDVPVVMGSTVFLSAVFCIIVFAVDLIYAFADPRIRARFSS